MEAHSIVEQDENEEYLSVELSDSCYPVESSSSDVRISKNQLKRQRREVKLREARALKRKMKKLKKSSTSIDKGRSEASTEGNEQNREHSFTNASTVRFTEAEKEEARKLRSEEKERSKAQRHEFCSTNFSIIIDCNWESIHAERPLTSLAQQILFCYGSNNKAQKPSLLYVTGVGARLEPKLAKCNAYRWGDVEVSAEEYTFPYHRDKQVVYLTSDAPDTLYELDTSCAYVIGGIVDRNAHKGVTYAKALAQGVRALKLPILEHCSLNASSVLTVNQILDILLKFAETGSWAEAIGTVIPLRKRREETAPPPDPPLHAPSEIQSPQNDDHA